MLLILDRIYTKGNKPESLQTNRTSFDSRLSKILDSLKFTNYTENINYLFETNDDRIGGLGLIAFDIYLMLFDLNSILFDSFAKWPSCIPDPLHTFMGICALSLIDYGSLKPIHPALVISMDAFEHMKTLHDKWSTRTNVD